MLEFLKRKKTTREQPRSAQVGSWGEQRALAYLTGQGFVVLGRNVRPNRHDEIDLIVRKDECLIFVEVKTRGREDFGRPFRAVDQEKRHALNRAAAAYLRKARFPDLFYRFDVIEVLGRPEDPTDPIIRHIDNAFPFESRFKFPV